MPTGIPRADIFHAIETIILAMIGLLVVVLIVRPILRKVLESASGITGEQQGLLGGGSYGGAGASGGVASGAHGWRRINFAAKRQTAAAGVPKIEMMIDISRLKGASSVVLAQSRRDRRQAPGTRCIKLRMDVSGEPNGRQRLREDINSSRDWKNRAVHSDCG